MALIFYNGEVVLASYSNATQYGSKFPGIPRQGETVILKDGTSWTVREVVWVAKTGILGEVDAKVFLAENT
ncbi:hypothetical protein D2T29_12710 [Sinirhodobacter populi]|uniref:Uncharacterized protein n=1 Tax=Paenirhodobacter populi TaxID=2306993 RepID=A0A443KCV4_9RHOB|nr:hypothetical protein [Sinirhodobacter populi]RWR30526.1 hypothetical protein D2T29_12710 [Sinirhodobacter populi]